MTPFNLWQAIRKISGWYNIIFLAFGKDKADEIEAIDDEVAGICREEKEHYRAVLSPKIKSEIEEFKLEFPVEWKTERESEYLALEIEKIQQEIMEIYKSYQKSIQNNWQYWLRKLGLELSNLRGKEKKLKSLTMRYRLAKHGKELKGKITPEMIVLAKEYPFTALIESKKDMAICPFHNDKSASFWIKNNYGYCFSCGWKGDVIDFLMAKDNYNFIDAVKKLHG